MFKPVYKPNIGDEKLSKVQIRQKMKVVYFDIHEQKMVD